MQNDKAKFKNELEKGLYTLNLKARTILHFAM